MLPECFGQGIANWWLTHRDYLKIIKDALASNKPVAQTFGAVGLGIYIGIILGTKGEAFLPPQFGCKQCEHLPICLSTGIYAIIKESKTSQG